ncbi:MAG: TonB-dependent receptor domain-containing protein [Bryobacteraceae bacterium]
MRFASSARYLLSGLLALMPAPAIAQTRTAEINGRITDPSGGVVAEARVTARNLDTGAVRAAISSGAGDYTAALLEPGNYEVTVERAGFSTLVRSGILLHVNDSVKLDFTLQIGDVTQTITVVEQAPLLRTSDSALGQIIDNTKVTSLPLNGRSSFRLVELTTGYIPTQGAAGQFGDIPVNTTWDANFSINGGQGYSNEIMIDGAPSTAGFFNQITTMPSVDSLVEFKVETNSMSAEFGRFGGGVLNVTTKSGTNVFHGSLFEFLRNDKLDANDFFNNRAGSGKVPFRMNQFGGSVGGPLRIPQVYNGRNRSFFFFNYEGTRWRRGDVSLFTLPTALQRQGDFSRTFAANGQLIQIYDPASTRADPARAGAYLRTAFPGNVIPANRINPVGRNIFSYYPAPNTAGDPVTGLNNFVSNAPRGIGKNQFNARGDHQISAMARVFARFSSDVTDLCQPDTYGNPATPGAGSVGCTTFRSRSAALEQNYTLSPTRLLTVRYGFARWFQTRLGRSYGFDQKSLGLPASLVAQQQVPIFPTVNVNGYGALGTQGNNFFYNGNDTHSLLPSLAIIHGRHVIKAGADLRLSRINIMVAASPGGVYNFTQAFTQGPDPNRGSATAGDSFASLMLGVPASGSMTLDPGVSMQNFYYAGYLHDDIKLTGRLTLNAGIRFETESPYTERRNQLVKFDRWLRSPAANAAFPNLTGGLSYGGGSSRYVYSWDKNNFSPRLGLAFQAAQNTVVRAGVGIFYAPLQISSNAVGFSPTTGYSSSTPMVTSVDGGLTPFATLSNPFPNGLVAPTGSSLGAATGLGQALSIWGNDPVMPGSYQWNVDLQRQLPYSVLVDVAYVGNRGVHLAGARQINTLPTQYLAMGPALLQTVRNPFAGTVPTGTMAQPNVTASRLLRPFPQFEGISYVNETAGNSIYHALQMKVEKRMSAGLSFLVAYTAGKLITDVPWAVSGIGPNNGSGTYQDWNNLRLERSLSAQDISQAMAISYNYELPLGKGKPLGTAWRGPAQWLLGGWQINGITRLATGTPLGLTTSTNNTNSLGGGSRPNSTGTSAALPGGRTTNDRINQWFDTSVFTLPAAFTYGNVARTLPDVRAPGVVNFNTSLFKNLAFKEIWNLQIRAEFFNLLNHPAFGPPAVSAGARAFGTISSTAALPRVGQFALKLTF